jgi:hypothetical protein
VRVEAVDRKRLEQPCRYIARPALSDERVRLNAAGQVELQLKTQRCDGATHVVTSPLEFKQRLAALVPRPRLRLFWCYDRGHNIGTGCTSGSGGCLGVTVLQPPADASACVRQGIGVIFAPGGLRSWKPPTSFVAS